MTPLEDGKSPENEQQDSTTKSKKAQEVESEIYNSIYTKHLTLVGWYRSKPAGTRALPSLRDSEAQLDHQIKLLGSSDATYSPCIGMIISPYTSGSTESELLTYWTVSLKVPYVRQWNHYVRCKDILVSISKHCNIGSSS